MDYNQQFYQTLTLINNNEINKLNLIYPNILLDQNKINTLSNSLSNNNLCEIKFIFNSNIKYILNNQLLNYIFTFYKQNKTNYYNKEYIYYIFHDINLNNNNINYDRLLNILNISSLNSFIFKDDDIIDMEIKNYISNILNNKFINKIHLSYFKYSDVIADQCEKICKSLLMHDNIYDFKLNLDMSTVDYRCMFMDKIINSLQNNYYLINLSLSGNMHIKNIIKLINQNKYLENVKLQYFNEYNEKDISKLFNSLNNLKYLKCFKFINCALINECNYFINFNEFLDKHKNLNVLSLAHFNILNIDYIIELLLNYPINKLSLKNINTLESKHIIKLITSNKFITKLNLSGNANLSKYYYIGGNLSNIFKILTNNNNIIDLDISNIFIPSDEIDDLCNMIINNKSLLKLNVENCFNNITDLIKFINALQYNNTLLQLKIHLRDYYYHANCTQTYDNGYNNDFITSIYNLIQVNKTLTHLYINTINCASIKYYNLRRPLLSKEQFNKIYEAIQKNNTLININWFDLYYSEFCYLNDT